MAADRRQECLAIERPEHGVGAGPNRRGARDVAEQRDLADEAGRCFVLDALRQVDLERAALEDVEGVAVVATLEERGAASRSSS